MRRSPELPGAGNCRRAGPSPLLGSLAVMAAPLRGLGLTLLYLIARNA